MQLYPPLWPRRSRCSRRSVPGIGPCSSGRSCEPPPRCKREEDGSGCLSISRISALPPERSLALIPGDSAGDAGAGSAPWSRQFLPAEVSSPIFCSGSQALRKLAGVSQGGRKQSTGRAGQGGAACLPRGKNSNELEPGLLVFWLGHRSTGNLKHMPSLTIALGKPNAPPRDSGATACIQQRQLRSQQICAESRKAFLTAGKSC